VSPAAPGPITVAHVITRLDVGGAQATAVRTCALLDPDRYRPVILAGADAGSGGSMADQARDAGVEVVTVDALVSAIRPHTDVRAVGAVRRAIEGTGAALVHTHSSKAGAIGRLAARRAHRPAVHTVHGWSFHGDQHPAVRGTYRSIEKALAPQTAALIVVTPVDERIGIDEGIGRPEQYRLIRSGIAIPPPRTAATRTAGRAALGWDDGVEGMVAVGRLAPQKDPLALMEAFAAVVAARPQARLAVVGDGPDRSEVEAAIERLGLAGPVALLGLRTDVLDVLAAADLFVLSSRWEGLPRTVLEAVALGVPVAATDVGGVREVIEPGVSGWLVPPGAPALLGAAAIEALGSPHEAGARAEAAREGIDGFDEQRMATDTMALYDEVLGR
jgi:glycosyltransferase involved in cell wall biosynthesis